MNLPQNQCTSIARRSGERCKRPALPGVGVCNKHGGQLPRVRAASERHQAEVEVFEAVRTFGLRRDITPAEALIEDVQWTAGHVEWLREQVQQLEAGEIAWGTTKTVDQQSGKGRKGLDTTKEARVNVLVDLYSRERKHLVEVCRIALNAGVEAKRVELAQRIGEQFAAMFRAVLADKSLSLTTDQVLAAHAAVSRHLSALTS